MKYQAKVIKKYEKLGYYVIDLVVTNKKGIADLLCLKKGEVPLFVEVKDIGDTIKPLQRYRAKELQDLGFESIFDINKKR